RASLSRLLRRARLVTVVGLCGVGKTRLARQVMEDLIPEFDGQVWFIQCEGLENTEAIDSILSEASGLSRAPAPGGRQVVPEIARRRALIFLDTAECLLENGLRESVQQWLGRAPG